MSDNRSSVQCVVRDIAQQSDVDAVVNAANAQLRTGGGVVGALHRAAGPGLAEEGRPVTPIVPGQAILTGGHDRCCPAGLTPLRCSVALLSESCL